MVRLEDESGVWFSIEPLDRWMDELPLLHLKAGTRWFNGELDVAVFPDEIERLAQGLAKLHADGAGAFRFQTTYENCVDLTFAMGKRGDLAVTLKLQNKPDFLHELRLTVHVDQSYLPTLVLGVRDIIAAS